MGTISNNFDMKLGIITYVDDEYNYVWSDGFQGLELRYPLNPEVQFECGEIVRFVQSKPTKRVQIVTNLFKTEDRLPIEMDDRVGWKLKVHLTFAPTYILDEYKKINTAANRLMAIAHTERFNFVVSYLIGIKYKPGVVYEAYISRVPRCREHECLAETFGTLFMVIGGTKGFTEVTDLRAIEKVMKKCHWREKVLPKGNSEIQMCKHISNLFDKRDQFSDCILVSSDKIEFKVYKGILACRSPVFAAMFQTEMIEAQNGIVHIEDIHSDVLEKMLRFIYSGTKPNMENIAGELLFAAEKYELGILKEFCERELANSLDNENVCELLVLADQNCSKFLKATAIKYIKENAEKVIQTEGWKMIVQGNFEELFDQILKAITKGN